MLLLACNYHFWCPFQTLGAFISLSLKDNHGWQQVSGCCAGYNHSDMVLLLLSSSTFRSHRMSSQYNVNVNRHLIHISKHIVFNTSSGLNRVDLCSKVAIFYCGSAGSFWAIDVCACRTNINGPLLNTGTVTELFWV